MCIIYLFVYVYDPSIFTQASVGNPSYSGGFTLWWLTKINHSSQVTTSYLVREAGADGGLDALVQVRVSKNQGRVFAPQLQRELLTVRGAELRYNPSRRRGAGEGDEGNVRMADESTAGSGPRAKHDVDHPRGDTCTHGHGNQRVGVRLDNCCVMGDGGLPACCISLHSIQAVTEVISLGLATTVFPAAMAGAIFQVSRYRGRFQGLIRPAANTTQNTNTLRDLGGGGFKVSVLGS